MATKGFPTLSYLNLSSFVGKTLNLKAFLYPPRWLGVGIVPHLVSVRQTTLDGRVLNEEEFDAVESEVHGKAPCTKQCWEAVEERCVCRCGGRNHGAAYRNLANLDEFSSEADDEGMPVAGRDIMRSKMELLWRARREIIAAYSYIGGLRG
jgi:hypothetical protein